MATLHLPTARFVAPTSLLINLAAQTWALALPPNMKTISDRNMSAFTPYLPMVALFFTTQQIVACYWIYRLWTTPSEDGANDTRLAYTPTFASGNLCLAGWSVFWHQQTFIVSEAFLVFNLVVQLAFVIFKLPPYTEESKDIHFISKLFAGITVLDVLHNGAVMFQRMHHGVYVPPSTFVIIATGVFFGIGGAMSDWILGAALSYDLLALSVGQYGYGSWPGILGAYAFGCFLIVAASNWNRRSGFVPLP